MSLPSDFDYKKYLLLNPDLNQKSNYEDASNHYINFGLKENRRYKINEVSKKLQKPINIHILVVVVSCNKNIHLWKEIKNRTNNDLIILSATNNRTKPIWHDKENKVLWLNCNDYYDGLPEKIVLTIEEVLNNPDFKHITHILKIDDHDTYFTDENIKNLYNLKELHLYNYIGQKKEYRAPNTWSDYHFGKVTQTSHWNNKKGDVSDVTWLDGGCSYILSRKAMKYINKFYNSSNINTLRRNEIYEDVMIGRLLEMCNCHPHLANFNIKGDK